MLKIREYLSSKLLALITCTSLSLTTIPFSGGHNIAYASETPQAQEASQKSLNIQTMLSTSPDNRSSYWSYFADSNEYPYYVYLKDYYNGKGALLPKEVESFLRRNIDPLLIGIGDKIYNDNKSLDQSQFRAKAILISMINGTGKDVFSKELADEQLNMSKNLISSFDMFIQADKELYNKLFDGRYDKLEKFNKKIEESLRNMAKSGITPTPKVLIQSEEFIEISKDINKADLLKKLDKDMADILEVSSLWKKLGKGMDIVSSLKIGSDEYYKMYELLQADNNFIDFLELLETKASKEEVRKAAGDLKKTYKNELINHLQVIETVGIQSMDSWLKGLSWQVSLTNLAMNTTFNVGDKIDKFDRLRLSSDMSVTLDNVMAEYITQYNSVYDTAEKNKIADSIYKYAPYLFALRLEGENDLYEYLKLIGANKNQIVKNKDNDITYIESMYNTLYKNIRPSADFSYLKEEDGGQKQDIQELIKMNNQSAFNSTDFVINNINLETIDNKYFTRILGEPISSKVIEGPPCDVTHYYYPDATVSFADNSFLYAIEFNDENFKGPRNTSVGQDIYEVISKFKCDSDSIENNVRLLYSDDGHYSQFAGSITYESGKIKTVKYFTEYWNWNVEYEVKDDKVTKIRMFRMNH